jgi:hypothetical protein
MSPVASRFSTADSERRSLGAHLVVGLRTCRPFFQHAQQQGFVALFALRSANGGAASRGPGLRLD